MAQYEDKKNNLSPLDLNFKELTVDEKDKFIDSFKDMSEDNP